MLRAWPESADLVQEPVILLEGLQRRGGVGVHDARDLAEVIEERRERHLERPHGRRVRGREEERDLLLVRRDAAAIGHLDLEPRRLDEARDRPRGRETAARVALGRDRGVVHLERARVIERLPVGVLEDEAKPPVPLHPEAGAADRVDALQLARGELVLGELGRFGGGKVLPADAARLAVDEVRGGRADVQEAARVRLAIQHVEARAAVVGGLEDVDVLPRDRIPGRRVGAAIVVVKVCNYGSKARCGLRVGHARIFSCLEMIASENGKF